MAVCKCLVKYSQYAFSTDKENVVKGGSSKVDYVVLVDDEPKALCEEKSASVMKTVGELLPPWGIKLKWNHSQSPMQRLLGKVSTLVFHW